MAKKIPGMRRKGKGYEYRFTYKGERLSVSGTSVDDCLEKAKAKRDAVDSGALKPTKDQTLAKYYEAWIVAKEGTVKDTTIVTYDSLFKKISEAKIDERHTFGSLPLKDIETQHIRIVQKELRKDWSTRSTNDALTLMRSIFRSAVNERVLEWNPATPVKPLRRTEPKARTTYHRSLSREETLAFLEAAKNSWYYNLYQFLLNTGCRIGEAGAIYMRNIDDDVLHVTATLTKNRRGGFKIGDMPKSDAGYRDVPLLPEAKKAISRQRYINQYFDGKVVSLDALLFRSPNGLLLNDSIINVDIARICKASGVQKVTAHAFRDTFATRCIEAGMQPKTLQEIMGHEDITITMNLYAHVMDDTKVEQIKKVSIM